jgi:hypothetical protein
MVSPPNVDPAVAAVLPLRIGGDVLPLCGSGFLLYFSGEQARIRPDLRSAFFYLSYRSNRYITMPFYCRSMAAEIKKTGLFYII